MTMPTTGSRIAQLIDVSSEEGGGVPGALTHVVSIAAQRRDVTDLAPGRTCLAVHVDPHAGVAGQAVQVARVHVVDRRRRARWPSPPAARSSGCRPAAGRARRAGAARTGWSRAPSMVQCPLLCGRIASSLTSTPASVSNISTAITPVTPSPSAIRSAACCAASAWSSAIGAGATTSRQTPSTWTVSTTGQTAAWPCGLRATSTASSRLNATRSSASSGTPAASQSAASAAVVDAAGRPCRRSRRAGS